MNKIALGKFGEGKACEFLKDEGYTIIERNFKTRFGEIDIIAKENNCLAFIEVKTRSNLNFGLPEEAITQAKRAHLIKSAYNYLASNKSRYDSLRFDVVSVLPDGKIELIKEAFTIE